MVNQNARRPVQEDDGLSEFNFFREDIVTSTMDPARLLGVIESVGGHSDDEEDGEEVETLERGKARVSWFKRTDNPQTVDVNDLEVVDRALMNHDIVALRSDPLGQTGFVTDVEVFCDLKYVESGRIQRGVTAATLTHVVPLKQGTYVVYGHWLGKVDECHEHVVVRWDDGSMCRFDNADPEYLTPEGWFDGMQDDDCPYYPGIRVTTTREMLQMEAKWIKGKHRDQSHGSGLVISVSPGRSFIRWISSSPAVPPEIEEPDEEVSDAQQLTILSAFSSTWFQLGDYALVPPPAPPAPADDASSQTQVGAAGGASSSSSAASRPSASAAACGEPGAEAGVGAEPEAAQPPAAGAAKRSKKSGKGGVALFRNSRRGGGRGGVNAPAPPNDVDRCVEVVGTRTDVMVKWQDGTVSGPHCTTTLVPVKHIGSHDFWPDEFVVEKLDSDAEQRAGQASDDVGPPLPTSIPADDVQRNIHVLVIAISIKALPSLGTEAKEELERVLCSDEMLDLIRTSLSFADFKQGATRLFANNPQLENVPRIIDDVLNSNVPTRLVRLELDAMYEQADLTPEERRLFDQLLRRACLPSQGSQVQAARRRMGVVNTVDWKERVCNVDWIGYCNNEGGVETIGEEAYVEEARLAEREEGGMPLGRAEVSSYEVLEHPQYTYSAGDVVVRVVKTSDEGGGEADSREAGASATRVLAGGNHLAGKGGSKKSGDEDGWETVSEHTDDEESASGGSVVDGAADVGDQDARLETVRVQNTDYLRRDTSSRRLPAGWAEHTDAVTGRPYYYHEQTGQSRWQRPRPVAVGWTSMIHKPTGREYFYHSRSGTSQWDPPPTPKGNSAPTPADWVGEVVQISKGKLQVEWLDGKTEWVNPGEVYVVGDEEEDWEDDEGSEWESLGSGQGMEDGGEEGAAPPADVIAEDRHAAGDEVMPWQLEVADMDKEEDDDEASTGENTPRSAEEEEGGVDEQHKEVTRDPLRGASAKNAAPVAENVMLGGEGAPVAARGDADAVGEEDAHEKKHGGSDEPKVVYTIDSMSLLLSSVGHAVGGLFRRPSMDVEEQHQDGDREAASREASTKMKAASRLEHERKGEAQIEAQCARAAAAFAGSEVAKNDPEQGDSGAVGSEQAGPVADFEQFLVEEELPRHHFASRGGDGAPPTREFVKKVKQEWKLLGTSLPEGVYVRACENRMDLLRAVIVGPTKTPYEDGLFMFDFLLPVDYPASPPQVHFWSFGDRLNPNLYENGKVCLSLLGTWGGDQVEVWDPAQSNILQVLISIQGLVLVPEPYYNEAGYERQMGTMEGRHNSRQYNESTLLLTLKHMTVTLNNLIEPFADFTTVHFRSRRKAILSRCQQIIKGASSTAGEGGGEASVPGVASRGAAGGMSGNAPSGAAGGSRGDDVAGWVDRSVPETASKGFLLSLKKIQPKLETVLPTTV